MNCYKCGTDKDLSLKRRLKTGHEMHICKGCRRAYYHAHFTPKIKITIANWNQVARIINGRIMEKYR